MLYSGFVLTNLISYEKCTVRNQIIYEFVFIHKTEVNLKLQTENLLLCCDSLFLSVIYDMAAESFD